MSTTQYGKTKKSKTKKENIRRRLNNRRGIALVALLAVMILIVNMIVFSYSWFTPKSEVGKGLYYEKTTSIRSENCEFKTYKGTIVNEDMVNGVPPYNANDYRNYYIDQIKYDSTEIQNNDTVTVPAQVGDVPGRVYFRTEIQNNDENYSSVVSLYHYKMPANLRVAVTYPTNTYHYVDPADLVAYGFPNDGWPDYYIIRNAYVKKKDKNDVDGPGLLPVEWFVENRTSSDIIIRVTPQTSGNTTIPWLYLMYN